MKGKDKCEFLREVRKRIAKENDIEYNPKPCTHKGDCSGTCPLCDEEASRLMDELRKKETAGLPIRANGTSTSSERFYELIYGVDLDDDMELYWNNDIMGYIS